MKICFPLSEAVFGGAEKYALNLAQKAKESGDEVLFLLNEENEFSNHLKKDGFEFRIVKMESSFNPAKVARAAREFKRIFVEEKIDIVHVQFLREHSIAIMARKLWVKIKIVRTFHRLDQFNLKMKPLIPVYNSQTDAFIAPTEFIKEYLEPSINKTWYRMIG
jgi:hypothetical protein